VTTAEADWEHPAVFLVNGIGDQLITLPAVRALCSRFPAGVQLLLGEGMLSFYYQGLPIARVTRVWWDDRERQIIDVPRAAAAALPCDLFVSLSRREGVPALARQMGAACAIGILDASIDAIDAGRRANAFDLLFDIVHEVDPSLQFDDFSGPPAVSDAAEAAAAALVSGWRRPGERLLFVHPETKAEKMWAPQHVAWVLNRFLARHPEYRVIVSSLDPVDFTLPSDRVHYSSHHLELTVAMVGHADVFLGVDSCFLHAADLFRVPGVGLFGPTDPARWGFRLSPLFRHVHAETMQAIRPEAVLMALEQLARALGRRTTGAGPERRQP
jgi:hypothetical protein